MSYFARFEAIDGQLFRFDTRIYLDGCPTNGKGRCVAAIVGKNPGSATASTLDTLVPLELNGDKMLPTVRNRFINGYRLADKAIPRNAFIRVWNLFYLCDPDLTSACNRMNHYQTMPPCETEKIAVPVLWFGWGGDDSRLNAFKQRFLQKRAAKTFFYDHHQAKVVNSKPGQQSFAKHTQGMPAQPVEEYLASVV